MKIATRIVFCLILVKCADTKMEPFIIGGSYINIDKYPHSAYLEVSCLDSDFNPDYWSCGAVILNQKILLSAAHCILGCSFSGKRGNSDTIVAYLGGAHLGTVSVKRKIIDAVVHSQYDETSMANDVSVAVLKKAIPFGKNIKRAILSKRFPIVDRTLAFEGFVAGWGIINEVTQESSVDLKHVYQKLRSVTTCSQLGTLESGMFCAGSTHAMAEHPSEGDSGSGLMARDGIQLMGVLSFHTRKYPALIVYSNASYYYNWIRNNAKMLFCRN